MQHVKITLEVTGVPERELLMAMLSDAGYDGFEETDEALLAYIEEQKYEEEVVTALTKEQGITYATEIIPAQNWNALWESNFEPVIVADFCTIRAHFHDIVVQTPYDIQITPKMSFGTGHHATTQQMMLQMKDMPFTGLSALDFGTGTGVLAILAEMLGATEILAIDNDEWSVENALENVSRNNCERITVQQGSLEDIAVQEYDVILANINRHILLHYMPSFRKLLKDSGSILMSGLLTEDKRSLRKLLRIRDFA